MRRAQRARRRPRWRSCASGTADGPALARGPVPYQERERRDRHPGRVRTGWCPVEQQLGATTVLPDPHSDAVRGSQRDHVAHKCLQRQDDGSQCPSEQQKCSHDDESCNPPHIAIDSIDEVSVLRRSSADPGAGRPGGGADLRCCLPSSRCGLAMSSPYIQGRRSAGSGTRRHSSGCHGSSIFIRACRTAKSRESSLSRGRAMDTLHPALLRRRDRRGRGQTGNGSRPGGTPDLFYRRVLASARDLIPRTGAASGSDDPCHGKSGT